jgi:hypothetical protein
MIVSMEWSGILRVLIVHATTPNVTIFRQLFEYVMSIPEVALILGILSGAACRSGAADGLG